MREQLQLPGDLALRDLAKMHCVRDGFTASLVCVGFLGSMAALVFEHSTSSQMEVWLSSHRCFLWLFFHIAGYRAHGVG